MAGNLTLKGNHWTIRWYRDYVARGGFGRDPENLCRFLRVLLFWAPLRWLFCTKKANEVPNILIIVMGLIMVSGLSLGIGTLAIQANKTYETEGPAGFVPPAYVWYVAGSLVLLAVVIIVWSGLYRIWREKYKYAASGAFCPLLEVEGGLNLPVIEEPEECPAAKTISARLEELLTDYEIRRK